MGANVAFSLYGSLKGDSSFSGCNGNTFINSFYTNTGFQDYAKAMYYAKQSGFSSYAYDDDYHGGLTATCQGGYGVGCDATYGFAMHTYSTDTCDPKYVTGVTDNLSNLNSAMQATKCVKIYDSSSYNSNYVEGTALELLYYSSACFYQNYYSPDGECPDPYGKIAMYRQNFAKGLQRQHREQPYVIYTSEVEKGKTMVAAGSLLLGAALVVIVAELIVARRFRVKHKTVVEQRSDGLVKPGNNNNNKKQGSDPNLQRAIVEDKPYNMLASIKQSANREMNYRMAIFNGNVERIRDGVMRVCSWDVELTNPNTTTAAAQDAASAPPASSPTGGQQMQSPPPQTMTQADSSYPTGQHSSPFRQLSPSPLPSQDESVPMGSVNQSALNVSQLTDATALAAPTSSSAPSVEEQQKPQPAQAQQVPDMYDEVLKSRASMDMESHHEPSVEITASATAAAIVKRDDDYNSYSHYKGSAFGSASREMDEVYPARSQESIGDLSNASSTQVDSYLEAKMEAALRDKPSIDVIVPPSIGGSGGGQNDTEAVLVDYEDAQAHSSPSSPFCWS